MALQEGFVERAARPPGPADAPARVTALTSGRLDKSALCLRRAVKAEVGVLLSMLSASPLGSRRRLFRLFSAEVHGITASHQQLGGSLHHQKRPQFKSWFQCILLICVVTFVLSYALSSSSQSWLETIPLREHYQRFINQTNRVNLPPSYRVHPKHRLKPTLQTTSEILQTTTEILQTTERHTVPATEKHEAVQYHLAYPGNYHFIMDNTEVCKNQTPFLVLMVPVAPHNVRARDVIRQTWGKESLVQGRVVLTMFMLGSSGEANAEQLQKKVQQENELFHDLIQSDFLDTYLNLTIKTMVIMDWLVKRCPTAAYAMKIDSDMFLNIDNLLIMLQEPAIPKQGYLTGKLMSNRPVVRSKNSKWYVPEELYPEPEYPLYPLGMGYIFSNDLPGKFVEASKSIKPFNIEDAYIGMCMKELGLGPIQPPRPWQFKDYIWSYDRCEFSKIITYILGSSEDLLKYWTDLKKPEPPCKPST